MGRLSASMATCREKRMRLSDRGKQLKSEYEKAKAEHDKDINKEKAQHKSIEAELTKARLEYADAKNRQVERVCQEKFKQVSADLKIEIDALVVTQSSSTLFNV